MALVVRGCDLLAAPGLGIREHVDLFVRGDRIAAVEPAGTCQAAPDAEQLDARGLLAIPGLVNAHTHSPENSLRGLGEGLRLEPWLDLMFRVAGRYEEEDHYTCALAGAAEMLRSGTTAVIDHLWMTPPRCEAVDAVMRAYRDAGIRAAVAPLMDDQDDAAVMARALGVPAAGGAGSRIGRQATAAELVAQLETSMRRWQGVDGRLSVLAGPGGVQWCSDALLLGLAGVARRYGSTLHLHLLETFVQGETCRELFRRGAVGRLDDLGVLAGSSLAHGVWLDQDDLALVRERRAVVVHNPAANLRLGSGRAPVRALLDAGVTLALGTDGAASSDNQVLWDQLKLASLVHFDAWGVGVRAREALTMATAGGAAALGLAGELGVLQPGRLADVVLVDRTDDGLAGAVDTEAALALSETGRGVRHVLVGGRPVVRDGRCTSVDEEVVRCALQQQARRRRGRLAGAGSPVAVARSERLRRAAWTRWQERGGAHRSETDVCRVRPGPDQGEER